jgi:hypothetical protein
LPSPDLVVTTIVSLLVVLAALDREQHGLQLRALLGRHVARVNDDVGVLVLVLDRAAAWGGVLEPLGVAVG